MSVDIKDHRRYAEGKLAESLKVAEEKVAKQDGLLTQAPSAHANTGNEQLDKLSRAVQALHDKAVEYQKDMALKGISCLQEEAIRLNQFEFYYTKGQAFAYEEVLKMPERILAESKLHAV